MIDERRLIQAIDGHTEELATLSCLVIGLLKHIKETQGEDAAHNAVTLAIQEASKTQPPGRIGGNAHRIRDLAKYI
ncbi:hypothetical protein AAUI01_08420 [Pseudomonas mosselii]|uniref:hypothetical protein n=1 Tax=Pseudomonas mosselii TaxID=78327 RepID=UPI0032E48E24